MLGPGRRGSSLPAVVTTTLTGTRRSPSAGSLRASGLALVSVLGWAPTRLSWPPRSSASAVSRA
eukprot:4728647-Alexandrium_andersonii.AAC.1